MLLSKKTISRITLFSFITIGTIGELFAQGSPGGNMGGPPCWPPSDCDPEKIPINNGLEVLLLLGVLYGFYKIYDLSKKREEV